MHSNLSKGIRYFSIWPLQTREHIQSDHQGINDLDCCEIVLQSLVEICCTYMHLQREII